MYAYNYHNLGRIEINNPRSQYYYGNYKHLDLHECSENKKIFYQMPGSKL